MHNSARLSQSRYWSRLAGFGLGYLFRCGAVACLGELRHYNGESAATREGSYATSWKLPLDELAAELAGKAERFMHNAWDCGYGGWPWYAGAVETLTVYRRLLRGDLAGAVTAANKLVNQCHNGSVPILTKLASKDLLSECANRPTKAALKSAPTLYQVAIGRPGKAILSRCPHTLNIQSISISINFDNEAVLTVNGHKWSALDWTPDTKSIMKMALEDK
jgi:hypothetical protein